MSSSSGQRSSGDDVRLVGDPDGVVTDAVGESYYQDSLEAIAGPKEEYGKQHNCVAELRPEPENPYDANAVAVVVAGAKVGHLPKELAAKLHRPLTEVGQRLERPLACQATIVGGWDDGGSTGHYGIVLYFDPEDLLRELHDLASGADRQPAPAPSPSPLPAPATDGHPVPPRPTGPAGPPAASRRPEPLETVPGLASTLLEPEEANLLGEQFKVWQNELVNLTRRNRALYFKHTKSASLEIDAPVLDDVVAGLPRGWRFFVPSEPLDGDVEESTSDDPPAQFPEVEPLDNELVTQKRSEADLTRSLRALDRKTSEQFIDTGLRTLYLGIGFLNWTDQDGQSVESPLVLQPVDLTRESINSDFHLVDVDADPFVNPALAIALNEKFAIPIPTIDEADDLRGVLRLVREAVASQPHWQVVDRVVLASFSFHKEAMYRDLVENEATIAESPLVQSLGLGPVLSERLDFSFEAIPHDEIDDRAPATSLVSVSEADSTQRACIAAARDGKTFVMDGPPGTGKSQTITNLIAELMYAGKSVLFVSEKAAALDVVAQRLERAHLDSFVLNLHSSNATRKEVAHELGQALTSHPAAVDRFTGSDRAQLEKATGDLNSYALAINEIRAPLGLSVMQVLGRIEAHAARTSATLPDVRPGELSAARLAEVEVLSEELQLTWRASGSIGNFPWAGVIVVDSVSATRRRLAQHLQATQASAAAVDQAATAVEAHLLTQSPRSISDVERLIELLAAIERHGDAERVPDRWFEDDDLAAKRRAVDELVGLQTSLAKATSSAEQVGGANWSALTPETAERFSLAYSSATDGVVSVRDSDTADSVRELRAAVDKETATTRAQLHHHQTLAAAFGATVEADDPGRLRELARLGQMLGEPQRPASTWLEPLTLKSLRSSLDLLQQWVESYRSHSEQVLQVFRPSVLEIDVVALKGRLSAASGLAKFGSGYRNDKAALRQHTNNGKVDESTIHALDGAIQLQQIVVQLNQVEAENAGKFGHLYTGRNAADMDRIERVVALCEEASGLVGEADRSMVAATLSAQHPDSSVYEAAVALQGSLDGVVQTACSERLSRLRMLGAKERIDVAPDLQQRLKNLEQCLSEMGEATGLEITVSHAEKLAAARAEVAALSDSISSSSQSWSHSLGVEVEVDADVTRLQADVGWVADVRQALGRRPEPGDAERIRTCATSAAEVRGVLDRFRTDAETLIAAFDEPASLAVRQRVEASTSAVSDYLAELMESIDDIELWQRHQGAIAGLAEQGASKTVHDLIDLGVATGDVASSLMSTVYEAWLERVLDGDDRLEPIASEARDALVKRFREFDQRQVSEAAAQVINACAARRPARVAGAAAVIQREAEKKRKHMPIRDLLKASNDTALALKPCFMMSPLSVSQYIPSDLRFDVVVFDEASQVRPSEAVNCLYRARQAVIAGDPKQLPPTSFFDQATSDDDEYDAEMPEEYESVLSAYRASGVPMLPLQWHYRSQHEDLIAFSNRQFYESRLHTFPGALSEGPGIGVEFVHVPDGVYGRGTTRANEREAEVVVERILEHRRREPDRTLGVVAFSSAQAEQISALIDRLADDHDELNELLSEDRLDGFFVKNLENVQGDERDIIIFSIGYGPDENGKMTQSFGPLNREGGERRLNVAVTRARRRVEVVSSIRFTDITDSSQSRGVQELRRYLQFAEVGSAAFAQELGIGGRDVESPFEEAVMKEIIGLGYDVVPQVGVAGYRIDLGVRHPDRAGEFTLAVECDGATYHSSKVARDRDRLRQSVLEGLGWTVHRIWGPSWYRTRSEEIEKLAAAIRASLEREHAPVARRSSPLEVAVVEPDLSGPPDWSAEYVENVQSAGRDIDMLDPRNRGLIERTIRRTIEVEGPIHEDLLRERTRQLMSVGRMGSRIRAVFEAVMRAVLASNDVREIEPGVVEVVGTELRVRRPHDDGTGSRAIGVIPICEQVECIVALTRDVGPIAEAELLIEFARLFGFQRAGADIKRSFERSLRAAEDAGDVSLWDNLVSLGAGTAGRRSS